MLTPNGVSEYQFYTNLGKVSFQIYLESCLCLVGAKVLETEAHISDNCYILIGASVKW